MRSGNSGVEVRALQDVLNFHIRRLTPINVDGIFGPKTQSRLIEFQRANKLAADGVAGPNSNALLFMNEVLPISVAFVPRAGNVAAGSGFGIRPPSLIPPLTLPGFTPPSVRPPLIPVPQLSLFLLPPKSSTALPPVPSNGQTVTFNLTVPSRSDPLDPALRSFRQIVQLLDTLPQNFPFRSTIIGLVPNPVQKTEALSFGFDWGVKPTFDLTKLAGPPEFTVGVAGNAKYTLKVISRPGSNGLQMGVFAGGDFKSTFDYTSEKAQSTPLIKFEGAITAGVVGRF